MYDGEGIKKDWKQPQGSRIISQKVADAFAALPEDIRTAVDASPHMRELVTRAIVNDEMFSITNDVGKPCLDVQNLRRLIAEKGFGAIQGAIDAGAILPAVAAPFFGFGTRT